MRRPFANRDDAGRRLGALLWGTPAGRDALVLGLPRGGVPVAAAVATALGAPLDVLVVRKVEVPGQPGLAMGAVAAGGIEARLREVIGLEPGAARQFPAAAEREHAEVVRRERVYRRSRRPLDLVGRRVVLVDDGMATGITMVAAIRACRARGAARIVVAVPVAPPRAIAKVAGLADEVLCPVRPVGLVAVGQYYRSFPQLEDAEVRHFLSAARTTRPKAPRWPSLARAGRLRRAVRPGVPGSAGRRARPVAGRAP